MADIGPVERRLKIGAYDKKAHFLFAFIIAFLSQFDPYF